MSSGEENNGDFEGLKSKKLEKNVKNKKWKKIAKKTQNKKRTRSKITCALERSFNDNLDNEETHNTSVSSENGLDNFSMLLLTINLVIGEGIKSVSILISNLSKIETLIQKSISEFNSLFENEKVNFRLKSDFTKYGLKPSKKKNGFPKIDMPSFNPKTTVAESNLTQFTLVWKEKPSDYSIYFDTIHTKKRKNCQKGICYLF